MNKKVIFIILAALAFALIIGLAWFWLFSGKSAAPANTGAFGSGQNKPNSTNTSGASGSNSSSVVPAGGGNTAGNGTNGSSGGGSIGGSSGGTIAGNNGSSIDYSGSGGSIGGVAVVPGVDWVGGGSIGGLGGGQTTSYVPPTINQLNTGTVLGNPNIQGGTNIEGNNGNNSLTAGLLAAGAGAALCTTGLLGGVSGAGVGVAADGVGAAAAVPVNDLALNIQTTYGNTLKSSDTFRDNFLNCITRSLARAAVQQITASVVNWINSGFNGQPSFVVNYKQFFNNVADVAAGEFIRGSSLSFLCSPFQLKIRIALAQSYARRNAQSCTLTSVIKNVDKFMSGSFSQGGWGGMLQFTTIPTNNPFGAFAYAQAGLQTAQSNALGIKQQDYIIGKGFLSSQKEVCKGVDPVSGQKTGCTMVTVTPGSTIADALNKSLGAGQDQLGLAKSFDEIVNALLTQLMVKTLQNGLSSVSGNQGYASNYYTPEQQQAQRDAEAMLADMQGKVVIAQQYGSAQQGSISDIQNAQTKLNTLANCWETASSSTSHTEAQRATARVNADNALAALHSYDAQIDLFNANITHANAGIAKLQELQTLVLSVTSAADVAAVKAAYNSALSSGVIITAADVTTAQQDRSALQSALASRNQQTDSELTQCYAF